MSTWNSRHINAERAIEARKIALERTHHPKNLMLHSDQGSLYTSRALTDYYIAKMDESLDAFVLTIRTGNAVTDVIVNEKQKAADKQGIKFSSEFLHPALDGYDAYDIVIIIKNLLQNALEACERMEGEKRYISLSGRKRNFF